MKRKIIIGLMLFGVLFLVSGISVIMTIERTTADLNNLLLLHQVEIVREHLLVRLKRTQLDLQLRSSQYASSVDTIVSHVSSLDNVLRNCFECHHAAHVMTRLDALRDSIEHYKGALSRVMTLRANARRLAEEQDRAYRMGAEIIAEVTNINDLTNRKLRAQSERAIEEGRLMKTLLYAILIITPLLALGMSIVIMRGFTRPVQTIIKATRRLQEGALDHRIEGLRDEYGQVADSFNRMAVSLKDHMERMQWAEQVVVLGELAGGLAHEIKNPLAGVKATLDVLSADPSVTDENREALTRASESLRRMEGLLRSFLSFARPPAPRLAVTDLRGVLDSTIALAQQHPLFGRGRPEQVAVEKRYDGDLPAVTADPVQLQQVFLNLLLNAAEAMPGGGTVTVAAACDRARGTLSVRVSDTGGGVDDVVRDKIFQPFFTTKAKGTGLGLSISKRLIEQHGGTIRVEGNGATGATFLVTLPAPEKEQVQEEAR